MDKKRNTPSSCPSCDGELVVVRLECTRCRTEVAGEFTLCPVCRLDSEIKKLFELFIAARGNLKKVQRELGLSYPTVRLRIEEMFRKLLPDDSPRAPQEILAKVRSGDLSVEEAEKLLRSQ